MLSVVLLATIILTATAGTRAQAPRPEVVAKNLAENVLGERTVRSVRVSRDGREINIAWDAVLYRPAQTAAANREQLRGEAELATGSIMGVMRPNVIRFEMMLGTKTIARGERTPERFTIAYAEELNR